MSGIGTALEIISPIAAGVSALRKRSADKKKRQSAGPGSSSTGQPAQRTTPAPVEDRPPTQSFKRGGVVRGRGAKVVVAHGGERVLTKKQAKRYKKSRSRGR